MSIIGPDETIKTYAVDYSEEELSIEEESTQEKRDFFLVGLVRNVLAKLRGPKST